jgi:hypothetical protein
MMLSSFNVLNTFCSFDGHNELAILVKAVIEPPIKIKRFSKKRDVFIIYSSLLIKLMTANLKKPFAPGDIAVMHITHRWSTKEGWAAGGAAGPQELTVYETIDLSAFPSHDDFKGSSRTLACGDMVLILGYVGRPFFCSHENLDSEYDVYDVLTSGEKFQVMRWNLERTGEYEKALTGWGPS